MCQVFRTYSIQISKTFETSFTSSSFSFVILRQSHIKSTCLQCIHDHIWLYTVFLLFELFVAHVHRHTSQPKTSFSHSDPPPPGQKAEQYHKPARRAINGQNYACSFGISVNLNCLLLKSLLQIEVGGHFSGNQPTFFPSNFRRISKRCLIFSTPFFSSVFSDCLSKSDAWGKI